MTDQQLYTFSFRPDWMRLSNIISQLDRFDASWTAIEKREGQTLKQLKAIATIRSVGASTRIEGSRMTNDEVAILIKDLAIAKLEERDQQEVAGYFETLELIAESWKDMPITENTLKHLHNSLLRRSDKDEWHRGEYKQHSNVVEAKNPDGTKRVIFQTPEPGLATRDAMTRLVDWYNTDTKTLPLIKDAVFIYDFLSIHPFQDGNGRLSRLLGTLLLLKHGYSWIQYVSFEHEIENRKPEYYKVLMDCQRNRPGEEVAPWVDFFLDCLSRIQQQLMEKLEVQKKNEKLAPREKMILSFIENHPGSRSGEIAEKLGIPLPTVKRTLAEMVSTKQLAVTGAGKSTSYMIEGNATIKKGLLMRFSNEEKRKEFTLKNQSSFIDIKDIRIAAKFDWSDPNEWFKRLQQNDLKLQITCKTSNSVTISAPVHLVGSLYHEKPTLTMIQTPRIPDDIGPDVSYKKDYPIQVTVELQSASDNIDFDVTVIYDEA
jgi:Fic family protein